MTWLAKFLATTFYSGYSKIAPGTVGALITLAVYWFLPPGQWITILLISLILFFVGVWASSVAEIDYGHDAGKINIDEDCGMLISLIAVPKIWWVALLAFFLFRFFDIKKPLLINQTQSFKGGWGVMLDDVLAGIYTNILIQIIVFVFV